jgi:acyl dehydratase
MATYDRPFGRYFEDFEPGDIYRHWPGKTITEYDDHLFCMITMNHHPLHTNASAIANLEVEELTHQRPTFHGDTIYAETRVLSKKESASKPDRGVVTVETKGFNQRGEEVCYFRRKVMVWLRDGAPVRQRPYADGAWA